MLFHRPFPECVCSVGFSRVFTRPEAGILRAASLCKVLVDALASPEECWSCPVQPRGFGSGIVTAASAHQSLALNLPIGRNIEAAADA
jgi:hypothetical protein